MHMHMCGVRRHGRVGTCIPSEEIIGNNRTKRTYIHRGAGRHSDREVAAVLRCICYCLWWREREGEGGQEGDDDGGKGRDIGVVMWAGKGGEGRRGRERKAEGGEGGR